MSQPYIEVAKVRSHSPLGSWNKRYFWHIRNANGQVSLSSQMYATKYSAKRAAKKFGKANDMVVRVEDEDR